MDKVRTKLDYKHRLSLPAEKLGLMGDVYFFRHNNGRVEAISPEYTQRVADRFIHFYGRGKKSGDVKNIKRLLYSRLQPGDIKTFESRGKERKFALIPNGRVRELLDSTKRIEVWGNERRILIRNAA